MLNLDMETNARCALAAIEVLVREIDRVECSPDTATYLQRLAAMARQHVEATLIEGNAKGDPVADVRSRCLGAGAARAEIEREARLAWSAAAALRHAISAVEIGEIRHQLQSVLARTESPRIRRLCQAALRSNRLTC
ncbi:hypothetical protein [Xanthobacter pseudotagetidis]|uniref:hypothetical protein n=1 Tax=Xanthobacter pseudotagetidis TaxID=3119911 RepID=UPI00372BF951